LENLFHFGFPYLILMNKLMVEKKYDKVVHLFESQFDKFSVERSNSKSTLNVRKDIIPMDQLGLVSEALFLMV
jgi:hypothetical protein